MAFKHAVVTALATLLLLTLTATAATAAVAPVPADAKLAHAAAEPFAEPAKELEEADDDTTALDAPSRALDDQEAEDGEEEEEVAQVDSSMRPFKHKKYKCKIFFKKKCFCKFIWVKKCWKWGCHKKPIKKCFCKHIPKKKCKFWY